MTYRDTLAALIIVGHITPTEAAAIEHDRAFLDGPANVTASTAAADIERAIQRARATEETR